MIKNLVINGCSFTADQNNTWASVLKNYLKTFSNKDLVILHGPVCSLIEMSRKKTKRKSITLVRRLE